MCQWLVFVLVTPLNPKGQVNNMTQLKVKGHIRQYIHIKLDFHPLLNVRVPRVQIGNVFTVDLFSAKPESTKKRKSREAQFTIVLLPPTQLCSKRTQLTFNSSVWSCYFFIIFLIGMYQGTWLVQKCTHFCWLWQMPRCVQHFSMMGDEGCCGNTLMSAGTIRQWSGETVMHNFRRRPLCWRLVDMSLLPPTALRAH